MKMSVLLFFLLLSGSLLLSFADEAKAQMPIYDEAGRTYRARTWSLDVQSTYYNATANYIRGGGEYVPLANGHAYKLLDFDFGTRYVPRANWGTYFITQVSNAESKDLIDTRRNSTFTKAVLGTDFVMFSNRRFQLSPDLSITVPVERVNVTNDEVLNREGAMEFSGKLIGRAHWGRFDPFAFLGFTYRDEDRASLMPYGVGVEYEMKRWSLGLEVRGYQTVVKDKYTDTPQSRESIAGKNGGALRYFSVDPALLEANVWARGPITQSFAMKIGAGNSITGANTSAGWNVIAALSYSFQSANTARNSGFTPWRKRPVEDTERFKEEINDGVDQRLFTPPPSAPTEEDAAEQQKKRMQKDLDQTEMQIELKRSKQKP